MLYWEYYGRESAKLWSSSLSSKILTPWSGAGPAGSACLALLICSTISFSDSTALFSSLVCKGSRRVGCFPAKMQMSHEMQKMLMTRQLAHVGSAECTHPLQCPQKCDPQAEAADLLSYLNSTDTEFRRFEAFQRWNMYFDTWIKKWDSGPVCPGGCLWDPIRGQ